MSARGKRYLIYFIGFVFSVTLLFPEIGIDEKKAIPKPFEISPKRLGRWEVAGVVYNPLLDAYVVFFADKTKYKEHIVYSRVYNSKGKPITSLQVVLENTAGFNFSIAYNEKQNKIFIVWTEEKYPIYKLYGMFLNFRGRPISKKVMITERPKEVEVLSGIKINWIPDKNWYALGWGGKKARTEIFYYYLVVLNSKLQKVVKPTLVNQFYRWKINISYSLSAFVALQDKLLWGSVENRTAKWLSPVVWFTDFYGNILPASSADTGGMIYPGKKVKGGGTVYACYNPSKDLVYLTWSKSNSWYRPDQTYRENYFRIMDGQGNFKTKAKKLPKKDNFQLGSRIIYNSVEDRFFITYVEFKSYYKEWRLKKERLWGLYVNNKGKLQKHDMGKSRAFPLTKVTEPNLELFFYSGLAYNREDNEFFIAYELALDWSTRKIWGLIYK